MQSAFTRAVKSIQNIFVPVPCQITNSETGSAFHKKLYSAFQILDQWINMLTDSILNLVDMRSELSVQQEEYREPIK